MTVDMLRPIDWQLRRAGQRLVKALADMDDAAAEKARADIDELLDRKLAGRWMT